MKKKIGIVGWNTGENSFGITKPYYDYLSQFGQVHILVPQKGIVEDLDLLVLPGGRDLNPLYYDEVPEVFCDNGDVLKEYFFKQNLPQYIASGTPIYGICLGFRYLGATT